jgi:hypothetical protein
MIRKDVVVAVLATLCLTATLLMIRPTLSNPGIGEYDPWADLNDDGNIDIYDAIKLADAFGTSGTSINKTDLLLELQAKIDALNSSFLSLQTVFNARVTTLEVMVDQQQIKLAEMEAETRVREKWRAGLLQPLPCPGTYYDAGVITSAILTSIDLDPTTLGDQQTIFARQGSIVNIKGTFQLYCANVGDWAQAFFIYSWTPNWPPTAGYYQALYNGQPDGYPGITQSFSFNVIVPTASDYYDVNYLYFCSTLKFSVDEAAASYTVPLIAPCAVIVAGP